MFGISIWEAHRNQSRPPATGHWQPYNMRDPGNQPDLANKGYYNYPVEMHPVSASARAGGTAQSPNYDGRVTEVDWRPQSSSDREIVEAQGQRRSQSPYYGGGVGSSKQVEQRLQSPYYSERAEIHEDDYPERPAPVYGGRGESQSRNYRGEVQPVDGALGRARSRPTRVPVPTTYIQ
jgi:hypothetical protein